VKQTHENLKELVGAAGGFSWKRWRRRNSVHRWWLLGIKAVLDAGDCRKQTNTKMQCNWMNASLCQRFWNSHLVLLNRGVEENIFPQQNVVWKNQDELAEKRRPFASVGITRRWSKLYITYANLAGLFGSEFFHSPSRLSKTFTRGNVLEEVRLRSQVEPTYFVAAHQITILKRNKPANSSVLITIKRLESLSANGPIEVNHPVFRWRLGSSTMKAKATSTRAG